MQAPEPIKSLDPEAFTARSYDYVIIGGGTAGLVVAARLSENPNISVAVLEAGENRLHDPTILTPGILSSMFKQPSYDWCFYTAPQAGLNGRAFPYPRGKVLGGSSAMNAMLLSHPSQVDLDNWERLGNPGWNWNTFQSYFKRIENVTIPSNKGLGADFSHINPNLHGANGPLKVSAPKHFWSFADSWVSTLKNLRFGYHGDPRSGKGIGGFNNLLFIDPATYTRSYSANAYYAPNASRPNLFLITGAHVTKIVMEGEKSNLSASAVKFVISGQEYLVKANREVILSAGAIQSPQILELSGIGSPAILSTYGIEPLIENENVGENLQDHLVCTYGFEANEGEVTVEASFQNPQFIQDAMIAYGTQQGGPFSTSIPNASAYLSYTDILPEEKRASALKAIEDLQADNSNVHAGLRKQYELIKQMLVDPSEAAIQIYLLPTGGVKEYNEDFKIKRNRDASKPHLTITSSLLHPLSRGSIHIQSKDPTSPPKIDVNYFSHPLDIEVTSDAILKIPSIVATKPLASKLKNEGKVVEVGYEDINENTVKDFCRSSANTFYHPVGTCAMLPRAEGGVVDPKLIVYGTKNLRVVDASVFPLTTRANPSSIVYALAERASDIIKGDWAKS